MRGLSLFSEIEYLNIFITKDIYIRIFGTLRTCVQPLLYRHDQLSSGAMSKKDRHAPLTLGM